MRYCEKCGSTIVEGAAFCTQCGTSVNEMQRTIPTVQPEVHTGRTTVYDGEMHKCPSCGEVLNTFDVVCHACGFELRGTAGSRSVERLSLRMEQASTDFQRIQIVKNFPIPNTKEDLFEFMILAFSNFDVMYYTNHLDVEDISDAWLAKIEQCYQKARLLLEESELSRIERMYLEIKNKINANQKKQIAGSAFERASSFFGFLLIVFGALFTLVPYVGVLGIAAIAIGVYLLVRNKVGKKTAASSQTDENMGGFSSWSVPMKVLWVILNIYTLGIPALIYVCCKKK